jgi:phosphopantothenoylcysteine decarboxylase/phosphopantothenate--cysteine ligase
VVHHDEFPCVTNLRVDTAADMREAVLRCFSEGGGADIYISAAAISDFAPCRFKGKIPSGKKTTLVLEPLPKLLDEVIRNWAPITVAFKLGTAPEKQSKQMLENGVTAVLMNPPGTMGSMDGDYTLLTAKGCRTLKGDKEVIARLFWYEMIGIL